MATSLFVSNVLSALCRYHGERLLDQTITNYIIKELGEIEERYKLMELVPKPAKVERTLPEVNNPADKRPSEFDDVLDRMIAQKLLPDVLRYLGEGKDTAGEVSQQLVDALDSCSADLDGFQIVKHLDDHYFWEVDESLVDIMSRAHSLRYQFHNDRVQAWVIKHNIKPAYKVGDRVVFARDGGRDCTGTIVDVREACAEYIVQIDGESYSGSRPEQPLGHIVNYEKVKGVHADD